MTDHEQERILQEEFYQIIKDNGLEGIAENGGLMPEHHHVSAFHSTSAHLGGGHIMAGSSNHPQLHNHGLVRPTTGFTVQGANPLKRPPPSNHNDSDDDDDDDDDDGGNGDLTSPPKKRGGRRQRGFMGDKNKGLRHFSMRVCDKVKEKNRTTYNEVADELVAELVNTPENQAAMHADPPEASYDEKNIRRRVYDALNVLMAMDILAKEKKEIIWKGLPQNATQDLDELLQETNKVQDRIDGKRKWLDELGQQFKGYKALMERNKKMVATDPTFSMESDNKVNLPFIIVNTKTETQIVCEMTDSRHDIFFNFDKPFEIHDDNEILGRMIEGGQLHINQAVVTNRGNGRKVNGGRL